MNDRGAGPGGSGGFQNFELMTEELGPGRIRIRCRGELDLATNPPLAERLKQAVERRERVLVDLSECGYIDSTGIGTLIGAWRALGSDAGPGAIVVFATEPAVTRVLTLTGVGEYLEVTEDHDEALRLLEQS
jgi:anti-anti-sigma factor